MLPPSPSPRIFFLALCSWSCLKPWPCKAGYGCTAEPSNKAPEHLFSTGTDNGRIFRWAFDRYTAQDKNLDEARKLARDVQAPAVGAFYESLLAEKNGAFAGGITSLITSAAEAVHLGYQSAKWTYVVAWCKNAEPTFLRALFE